MAEPLQGQRIGPQEPSAQDHAQRASGGLAGGAQDALCTPVSPGLDSTGEPLSLLPWDPGRSYGHTYQNRVHASFQLLVPGLVQLFSRGAGHVLRS